MAVSETMIKNVCNMKLNNGTDSEGNVKTVNVSLGTLSASAWDAQKAYACASAIEGCLSKTIYQVQHVLTNSLQED